MKKSFQLLIFLGLVVYTASAQVNTSLRVQPRIIVPIDTTADDGTRLFNVGGGASVQGEIGMPFAQWLYAEGVLDAGILPLYNAGKNLQSVSLGVGAGARYVPVSRLVLKGSVYGGAEVLLWDGDSYLVPFLEPTVDVDFQLSPAFNLGLGGGYRMAFGNGGTFYKGMTVSVNLVYNLGTSKTGADIKMTPQLAPIYPLYYTYYDTNPLGSVTVRNGERDALKNVRVSYYVPQFMDRPKPSGQQIDSLSSGDEIEVSLFALFSNDVFEVTEGLVVAGEIHVDYQWLGQDFSYVEPVSVEVLNRNAMTWDDDRKAAAFVTANNPLVKSYSKNIAANIRGDNRDVFDLNFRIGMGLFEALTLHGTGYVVDPASAYANLSEELEAVDYIQFPAETLAYQAGDCDDLSVLYNAMLEAVGISTAFITAPGHIYTAFDLGIPMERAERVFADTSNLINRDGNAWVPVEVTLVEQGFLEAWRVGAREWRETSAAGTEGFYPTHDAWKTYKPVENPTGELVFLPDPDEVMRAYGAAVDRLVYQDVTPIVRDFQARINQSGGSPAAYNRIGVTYAKYGLLDEAEPWFRRAVSGRPYPAGQVNLGNIAYLRGDFDAAAEHYQQALEQDDGNPRALLGLAKASFELEDYGEADQSMIRLAAVNPQMADHYSYLGTATDSPVLRASSAVSKDVYGWDE
jgi:tetratricopeptide (TPR) repeat protein